MRTGGILKGDGCHELFTCQFSPRGGVRHRRNHDRVEENPHNNCHPDCCEEATSAESRAALLRRLRYRFVACHVIRNDLHDQQYGNKTAVSKKRRQICRRPFARSESHEDNKQRKRAKRGPVLKSGAQADAAIVQHSQQRNQPESDHKVRQVHRPARDSIDFERIQRRKNVACDFPNGHRLPWANDEIGEHHHPSCGEADCRRKNFGSVGDFTRRVRHGHYKLSVDVTDWKQQCAANRESQNATESAAAQQPVVHHHQPSDAHHRAPAEREVVNNAEFTGKFGHKFISVDPNNGLRQKSRDWCKRAARRTLRARGPPSPRTHVRGLKYSAPSELIRGRSIPLAPPADELSCTTLRLRSAICSLTARKLWIYDCTFPLKTGKAAQRADLPPATK